MNLKLLNEYPQTQMTEQQANIMFNIMMGVPEEVYEQLADTFTHRLLSARLAAVKETATVDRRVIAFLTAILDRPGTAVLYAHTLCHRAMAKPNRTYSWDDFINDFAHGFPDEDQLRIAWDAQKIANAPGGNYLDTQEAWQ